MNKDILKKMGFEREIKNIEDGKCPTCGKLITSDQFRNKISYKEYRISGLCQSCQDLVFGKD